MKYEHERKNQLDFRWSDPPLQVALIEPKIPPNTGNIARLCAATGSRLHLVEPLGFEVSDSKLKRAGLDYWESVDIHHHKNGDAFQESVSDRCFLFTTAASESLYEQSFLPGDVLVFGDEPSGLSEHWLEAYPDRLVQIPIRTDHVRSLNLANCVAIAVYEALRQFQSRD
jgi:tRNA (cytidine/uridine-2'-O-)-methyltransferase